MRPNNHQTLALLLYSAPQSAMLHRFIDMPINMAFNCSDNWIFLSSALRPRLFTTIRVSCEKHRIKACTYQLIHHWGLAELNRMSTVLSTPWSQCCDLLGGPARVSHSAWRRKSSLLPLEVSNKKRPNTMVCWRHLYGCLTPAPGVTAPEIMRRWWLTELLHW